MGHIEIISRGAWIHRGSVLLCRNLAGGYLYLPGGHVEPGESAAGTLRREFLEETGLDLTVGEPMFVMEHAFHDGKRSRHEWMVVFHVEHPHMELPDDTPPLIESQETKIGFEWFDLAAVINLDLRPIEIRAWLASGCSIGSAPCPAWLTSIRPE